MAKSLTLFKSLFAILGVPLYLLAISMQDGSSISTPKILPDRFTIVDKSSIE